MKRWIDRLLQRNQPESAAPTPVVRRDPPKVNLFQAVEVLPCPRSCEAARSAQGQRFLARKAPPLPLAQCDRPGHCACRFRKHDDRRVGPQRSPYASELVRSFPGNDRRRGSGRRRGDR